MKVLECTTLHPTQGYMTLNLLLLDKYTEEQVRKGNIQHCDNCNVYHPTKQFWATGKELNYFCESQFETIGDLSKEELQAEIVSAAKHRSEIVLKNLLSQDPTDEHLFHKIFATNLFVSQDRAAKYMDALISDSAEDLFKKFMEKSKA